MRDLASNFAKTTLLYGIGTTDLTFTVAVGTGSLFPEPTITDPGNLIITIDQEILLCVGFSGDLCTIAQRGLEGTLAVSHAPGAPVGLTFTAGMLEHLWQNVPDTFNADVMPSAVGQTASQWDDEFEGNSGLWSVFPQDGGGVIDYGINLFSYLSFVRQNNAPSTFYYFYQNFQPPGAFTVTCHLENVGNLNPPSGSVLTSAWAWFFVSDQANPTAGLIAGNRALIGLGTDQNYQNAIIFPDGTAHTWPMSVCQQAGSTNAMVDWSNTTIVQDTGYRYLRMSYDGSQYWTQSVSMDGVAYQVLATLSLTLTPLTLGWTFQATGASSYQQSAIDWVRVTQP